MNAASSSSLDAILAELSTGADVARVLRALGHSDNRAAHAVAIGTHGSSASMTAAALSLASKRPVLLVTAHLDETDEALDELAGAGVRAIGVPALETLPGESAGGSELLAHRLITARSLPTLDDPRRVGAVVVVAPVHALMQPLPAPSTLGRLIRVVAPGDRLDPRSLASWLDGSGYKRLDAVEQPGDFAVRGDIVDVFCTGQGGLPVRIDFFGDEVDRVSEIDLESMGSDRALDDAWIVSADTDSAVSDADSGSSVLDMLPARTIAVVHETLEVTEQARGYYERVLDSKKVFGPPAVFKRLRDRFTGEGGGGFLELNQFSAGSADARDVAELPVRALPSLADEPADAIREIDAWATEHHWRVTVCCQNQGERSRLVELLAEHDPGAQERIGIATSYLHRGFLWESARGTIALVPYHELLHRFESRKRGGPAGARLRAGRAMDTFLDFEVGDFVVHREHGIGVFRGLKVMEPRNVHKKGPELPGKQRGKKDVGDPDDGLEEYLTIEFAQSTRLHVPATKIDQVQKYIGGFRGKPRLSAVGGNRWKRQKENVTESVRDLASELLRVRAAREHMPGVTYPGDTKWQREFEDEFPYQETDDQLAALSEIKKDMTSARPMDRLLCGDVGYGKTELAIRAAFKACEYGKQVAVLVPTTVLAEQHERTFKSRFADYPFRVASISRFKTGEQIKQTLSALKRGEVDVIIGTHRLLSRDVKFGDLGLVVIDEEQRFGVEHKERLLSMRMTCDVLTLSATPIPRTLHMSMLGLRDISSLATAPLDRRAVVTEVIPYNEKRIRQAIARELARDGQVFFVHNRVHNIKSVADDVQRLAPKARIVIGHGQMPDKELEDVMFRFMNKQADILVSTTIIESGIDIPTANTMVINDADRFGLAELHQLRGRVGRYKHRAYCYLLLPKDRPVGEVAVKRLKAIEDYSMLGAGFKIAMRDLEIRGAGNILGPEQSGHIAAVGYEMYCQLLEQAVRELKGEPTSVASQTSVELGITGIIPKRYIASDRRRMEAYRRIAVAQSADELDRVERELTQAYGEPTESVVRLLDLARVRASASALGIRTVTLREPDVVFRVAPERAREVASMFESPNAQVAVLEPTKAQKTGDPSWEVYYRPPENYLEGRTLLRVVRQRLREPAMR